MTDVRKMLSPQTAGELQPEPGTPVFHVTFSLVLQVSGRFGSSAMPSEPGPRKPGQLSATAAATAVRIRIISRNATTSLLVISFSTGCRGVPLLRALDSTTGLARGSLANAIQILSCAHENLSV